MRFAYVATGRMAGWSFRMTVMRFAHLADQPMPTSPHRMPDRTDRPTSRSSPGPAAHDRGYCPNDQFPDRQESGNLRARMKLWGLGSSIGAGGSLIGAVLCAAALVGALIGFEGGPGAPPDAGTGDVTLPRERHAPPTRPVVASAATANDTAAARTTRRRRVGAPRAAVNAPEPRPAAPVGRAAPPHPAAAPPSVRAPAPSARTPAPSARTPAPSDRSPAPPTAAAAPAATAAAAAAAAGAVRRTVAQARAVVAPVVDALPAPVQSPVEVVADTVERAAGVVDETIAPIAGGG
jgi:hypothetical protein